jgi:5-bromo-4-chloroindolyl phosphate hydrolysis protein
MERSSENEREVRAARNQSLFRSINERMESLNEAFESLTSTFAIACECADVTCVEMLEIEPQEYEAVRAEPRHFAVRPGHVYSDVETVVREGHEYVVVEKVGVAGEVAEEIGR